MAKTRLKINLTSQLYLSFMLYSLGESTGTQGDAKPAIADPDRREKPGPERRPTISGIEAPTAATEHAERALPWSNRIGHRLLGVGTIP
ncbi:MAG: hypothetical protein ACKO0V_15520, partial [bacterium]